MTVNKEYCNALFCFFSMLHSPLSKTSAEENFSQSIMIKRGKFPQHTADWLLYSSSIYFPEFSTLVKTRYKYVITIPSNKTNRNPHSKDPNMLKQYVKLSAGILVFFVYIAN